MTDYPDVLLSYDYSTDPDMATVGSIVNLMCTVENKQDVAVSCAYISIDLNPGDGPESLATEDALGNATPQKPTGINASFTRKLVSGPGDGTSTKYYFMLTPPGSKYFTFKPGDKFEFSLQINKILVNNALGADGTLTTAKCRTIEKSSLSGNPVTNITGFTVPKYPTGTAFRNFTTSPADQVVVKRGDPLRLQWTAKPPFSKKTKHPSPPYYTMTIYYDQVDKPVDVTDNNSDNGGGSFTGQGGELLTLSHTTPFTLYLTLCDKNGQQITHSLTTLAVVSPTDVTLTDLDLNETASILTIANPVTQADTAIASTDGFLLCTVQGSANSEPSEVVISLTPPEGGDAVPYVITTDEGSQPDDGYTFVGPRILLPVAKGTTVNLIQTQSAGTYRAMWYPLGTGPLLGPLPPQPAPSA
ncbi:hypothetical protein [Streptomyces sp. BA2]|uniref:hypothetical protein n=1 Tax=Streptomyces sp. BA2 TaxID=436595 RepID=UPI001328E6B3|nr:hypothetical protein [Streptomyces sp. BA2]MWA07812.1 hypothetical protein [Streptomyces sp. BA2]